MSGQDNGWRTSKPPNETWVEVLLDSDVVEAMAYYGRDGVRPHWIGRDGRCWSPSWFRRWRQIRKEQDG